MIELDSQIAGAEFSPYITNFSGKEKILSGILIGITILVVIVSAICCQFQVIGFVTAVAITVSINSCVWMVGFCIRYFMSMCELNDFPKLKFLQNIFSQKESGLLSSYFAQEVLTPFKKQGAKPFIVMTGDSSKEFFGKITTPDSSKAKSLEKLLDSFFKHKFSGLVEYAQSLIRKNKSIFFEELINLLNPLKSSNLVVPISDFILKIFSSYSFIDFCFLFLLNPTMCSRIRVFLTTFGGQVGISGTENEKLIQILRLINMYLHGWMLCSDLLKNEICNCLCKSCPNLRKQVVKSYIDSGNILGLFLNFSATEELRQELKTFGIESMDVLAAENLIPKNDRELRYLNNPEYNDKKSTLNQLFREFKELIIPKLRQLPKPGVAFKLRLLKSAGLFIELSTILSNNQDLLIENPFLVLELLDNSPELQSCFKEFISSCIASPNELEKIIIPFLIGGACFGLITEEEMKTLTSRLSNLSFEGLKNAICDRTILRKLMPGIFD